MDPQSLNSSVIVSLFRMIPTSTVSSLHADSVALRHLTTLLQGFFFQLSGRYGDTGAHLT